MKILQEAVEFSVYLASHFQEKRNFRFRNANSILSRWAKNLVHEVAQVSEEVLLFPDLH